MSEPHTPETGAPPADEVEEHVAQTGNQADLGAGNKEPDPVTAENPPSDISAGDQKRPTGPGPKSAPEAGAGAGR
jgi:hypothetical protein